MIPALRRIATIRGVDPAAPVEVPRWRCGHECSGNTYINPADGMGRCWTCAQANKVAGYRRRRAEHARLTPEVLRRRQVLLAAATGTCPHGHYLDEHTTLWVGVQLVCQTCSRQACTRYRQRQTARRTS